ncbi:MAG: DUF2459 domain-containing protein [Anaerolineae bacterium]|nr:DUF2459 domain-containing protein [Phycisphaerae bacterium]
MIRLAPISLALLLVACGCCGPVHNLYPPPTSDRANEIYVYNNHWHTGFVIPWSQLSPTLRAHLSRFGSDTRFVEIGWGDEGFYRAPKGTIPLALRAMFASRGSVLHVAGLQKDPAEHYRDYQLDLYRIRISAEGNRRLMNFLEHTFARIQTDEAIELQPGLYGVSYFYRGRGWYGLFHNCNNWLADGVRSTGFPITPIYTATADNVGWQVRVFGRKYQADLVVLRQ